MLTNQLDRIELKQIFLLIFLLFFSVSSSFGINPDETLSNSELEQRAREISSELRCLVCRNENIDSSDAELAKDFRALVRERLSKGDTNKEVIEYVHARYGDFILLKPKFSGVTIILWLVAPFSFVFGSLLIFMMFFRKQKISSQNISMDSLSKDEEKKLKKLLQG